MTDISVGKDSSDDGASPWLLQNNSKKLLKRTRIRGIASCKRSRSPDGSPCGFQAEKLTNRKRWKERGGEEERDAEGGGRVVQQIPRAFPFVLFARHKRNI